MVTKRTFETGDTTGTSPVREKSSPRLVAVWPLNEQTWLPEEDILGGVRSGSGLNPRPGEVTD